MLESLDADELLRKSNVSTVDKQSKQFEEMKEETRSVSMVVKSKDMGNEDCESSNPFEKMQNYPAEDDTLSSNSNKTFSDLVKAENNDYADYKGKENADLLNSKDPKNCGFSIEQKEPGFTRCADIIMFCHGSANQNDQFKFEAKDKMFAVPANTKIFEYESPFVLKDKDFSEEMQKRENTLQKIKIRQDLLRGMAVSPSSYCKPNESCYDVEDYYCLFNGMVPG